MKERSFKIEDIQMLDEKLGRQGVVIDILDNDHDRRIIGVLYALTLKNNYLCMEILRAMSGNQGLGSKTAKDFISINDIPGATVTLKKRISSRLQLIEGETVDRCLFIIDDSIVAEQISFYTSDKIEDEDIRVSLGFTL